MLEIVPDGSLCQARIATSDHEVASGTYANLVGNMTR